MTFLAIDTYATRTLKNCDVTAIMNADDVGSDIANKYAPLMISDKLKPYPADCVFSHTRNVDRLESICKFVIQNDYPMMIWDIDYDFYMAYIGRINLLFNDFFKLKNYRVSVILYTTATFVDSPFAAHRYALIAYKDDKYFSLALPKLGETCLVYDKIGGLQGAHAIPAESFESLDNYIDLPEEERELLPKLYTGATYLDLRHRLPPRLQIVDFGKNAPRRLNWTARVPRPFNSHSVKWIHPKENRPLTLRELYALLGFKTETVYDLKGLGGCTLPRIGNWFRTLVKKYMEGKWEKKDDLNARIDEVKGWVRTPADPTLINYYELFQYANITFDKDDYPKHERVNRYRYTI